MKDLLKSPMNYIGNKFRLLKQIFPFFPQCNTMVDLFAGGLDVAINADVQQTYCNDVNKYLIDIYKTLQSQSYETTIQHIYKRINEFNLTKTNKEGFLKFRKYYNNSLRDPLDLYILMNYSFNYQIRFNSSHEYNTPFGSNRSSFNNAIESRLETFIHRIKQITFTSMDFKDFDFSILKKDDFIYCDPPYLISTGSYNDGKRGFSGWSKQDDMDLMNILDELSNKGIKFALSNILSHKGQQNQELSIWANKYTIHELNYRYSNCNYQLLDRNSITREVLITNE